MKQLGEPAKPFAQSAQYKKNFNKGETGEDEVDDLGASTIKPSTTVKAKKTKKKRPEVKNLKKTNGEETTSETGYQPQKYSLMRKEFIASMKVDQDLSHDGAVEAWNQSRQKRLLLAPVSVSELKRRKFIPKGCNYNPWAD